LRQKEVEELKREGGCRVESRGGGRVEARGGGRVEEKVVDETGLPIMMRLRMIGA